MLTHVLHAVFCADEAVDYAGYKQSCDWLTKDVNWLSQTCGGLTATKLAVIGSSGTLSLTVTDSLNFDACAVVRELPRQRITVLLSPAFIFSEIFFYSSEAGAVPTIAAFSTSLYISTASIFYFLCERRWMNRLKETRPDNATWIRQTHNGFTTNHAWCERRVFYRKWNICVCALPADQRCYIKLLQLFGPWNTYRKSCFCVQNCKAQWKMSFGFTAVSYVF